MWIVDDQLDKGYIAVVNEGTKRTIIVEEKREANWLKNYLNDLEEQRKKIIKTAIHEFVCRVNSRAELEMVRTGILEGAHHRAIEAELLALQEDSIK